MNADRKELSLSSSTSSSGADTLEDPSSWGDGQPPRIPAKPPLLTKPLNTMASAQNSSSLRVLDDPSKRLSNLTVFESMSESGDGLTDIRKQPLTTTMSVPLVDKRQNKMPAPPPDMDDIE